MEPGAPRRRTFLFYFEIDKIWSHFFSLLKIYPLKRHDIGIAALYHRRNHWNPSYWSGQKFVEIMHQAKMWQMFRQVWPGVRVLNHDSSKTLEFRNAITNGVTIQIQFCTWVLGGCHQLQEEVPSATELGVRCSAGVSSWKGMRPKSRALVLP